MIISGFSEGYQRVIVDVIVDIRAYLEGLLDQCVHVALAYEGYARQVSIIGHVLEPREALAEVHVFCHV